MLVSILPSVKINQNKHICTPCDPWVKIKKTCQASLLPVSVRDSKLHLLLLMDAVFDLWRVKGVSNAGLDSPLECGTRTWDWIIKLECGSTGIWSWNSILAPKPTLAYQTTPRLL